MSVSLCGVSVENEERKVTSFSFFTFLTVVTEFFLPEQFLCSYLKRNLAHGRPPQAIFSGLWGVSD